MPGKAIRIVFLFAAGLFAATLCAQQVRAQERVVEIFDNRSPDAARIAPDRCVVELDNDRMRIIRIKLPASSRVPIHSHRTGVVIALTELRLRMTAPDGAVIDIRLPAGDMRWVEGGIHAEENVGAGPAEYLYVESKG
jgi:hypothetical protein